MFGYKKTSKYPYLVLLFIHTALLAFTFVKNENRKSLFVLLMSNMGMATVFDYFILSFLRAYSYKPKFFRNKFLDNATGAIFSQAIYVPFTALFITAFKLNWKMKLLFAFYFAVIERIFINMGIFRSRGWKTTYTFVLIFVYFFISDQWLKLLRRGIPIVKKLTLFNMVSFTSIQSLFMLELPGILRFGLGHYHSWREQLKVEPLYSTLMALFKTWATLKGGIGLKVIVLLVKRVVDQLLRKAKIIKIKSVFPLLLIDIFLLSVGAFYKKWIEEVAYDSHSK